MSTLTPSRLGFADLARVASVGLRTRRLRAALSALGIAIGVASIVAVLGLSSSSQAGLLREIDRLGTNLLTVEKGQTLTGAQAELPVPAPSMIQRISGVEREANTGLVQRTRMNTLGLRTVSLPPLLDVDTIADAHAVAADAPDGAFARALAAIAPAKVAA